MRIFLLSMFLALSFSARAFKTDLLAVDFNTNRLLYKGKNFELVEIKSKVKRNHREINYYCLSDDNLTAVVFRLLVSDNGKFLKLIKYTSKK